jgi:hypothetical protein
MLIQKSPPKVGTQLLRFGGDAFRVFEFQLKQGMESPASGRKPIHVALELAPYVG